MSTMTLSSEERELWHKKVAEAKAISLNKTVEDAKSTREQFIYRFKRDFFLSIAASGLSVEEANARAAEIAEILFPAVTEANADIYINRAW